MVRGSWRTRSRGLLVALVWLLAACGGDDEAAVTEDQFTAEMTERFGASDTQARCITGYVFEDYEPTEIDVLMGEGMGALPQARWGPYLNASAACITHDQPLPGDG